MSAVTLPRRQPFCPRSKMCRVGGKALLTRLNSTPVPNWSHSRDLRTVPNRYFDNTPIRPARPHVDGQRASINTRCGPPGAPSTHGRQAIIGPWPAARPMTTRCRNRIKWPKSLPTDGIDVTLLPGRFSPV